MPIYASLLNVDKNQPPSQFKPAPLLAVAIRTGRENRD